MCGQRGEVRKGEWTERRGEEGRVDRDEGWGGASGQRGGVRRASGQRGGVRRVSRHKGPAHRDG